MFAKLMNWLVTPVVYRTMYIKNSDKTSMYIEMWKWNQSIRNIAIWDGSQWHQPSKSVMRSVQESLQWVDKQSKGMADGSH